MVLINDLPRMKCESFASLIFMADYHQNKLRGNTELILSTTFYRTTICSSHSQFHSYHFPVVFMLQMNITLGKESINCGTGRLLIKREKKQISDWFRFKELLKLLFFSQGYLTQRNHASLVYTHCYYVRELIPFHAAIFSLKISRAGTQSLCAVIPYLDLS